MFTGLIDDVGTIVEIGESEVGRVFRVECRYGDLADGESIAVNGACLTVREQDTGWFTVSAVVTTLGRTTIGEWQVGRRVNLERALRVGDRLGGHFVQGHVDGVATITDMRDEGESRRLVFQAPPELMRFIAPKGSVALDGVSLTVNEVGKTTFGVNLIPHTLAVTTFGRVSVGSKVNLEVDLLARYVARLTK